MFTLSDDDFKSNILGCSDGPASFNAVLSRKGGDVVSIDPIYQFTEDAIKNRISETYDQVIEQTRKNRNEFVWSSISSIEALGQVRMAAMSEFLSDFKNGKAQGRYLTGGFPRLPFRDGQFALSLCSHYLFLYSEQLSIEFHIEAIKEMCRVAREARIFPLLELGAISSRHLEPVMSEMQQDGYQISVESVSYEFQRGGNKMLRVQHLSSACS
jgi:hypothetical protein